MSDTKSLVAEAREFVRCNIGYPSNLVDRLANELERIDPDRDRLAEAIHAWNDADHKETT
jgi:hypothetical protein